MGYSTRKKRGRPKLNRTPFDYGNDRVQARAALFETFGGGSAKGFEMTCAGRLMLVGCFDGMEITPEEALSALLEYSNAYWGNYGGGPKVAAYERQDRGHESVWEDPRGEWFDAMDQRLRDAGYAARQAVHNVTVERHWFPDEDAHWAAAIINRRFVEKGLPVAGEVAFDGHSAWAMLDLLKQGAMALARGTQLRRAA